MQISQWFLVAMILIPVCLVLLVLLILTMMKLAKAAGKAQSRKPPVTKTTGFGEFVKIGPLWMSEVFYELKEVSVFVKDIKGEPNPVHLIILPAAIENLVGLEAQARQAIPELKPAHRLVSICLLEVQGEDFSLNFDTEEPAEHEMAVYFKEMQVMGYSLDD